MTMSQQNTKRKQEEHELKETCVMMVKVLDLVLIALFFCV